MLGSKVSNLLLAEKNLIDFVEKNLGQERDRLQQNELEQTPVCSWISGGNLDFPNIVSHDLCDITTALDIYAQAFMKTTAAQLAKPFGHGIFVRSAAKNERLSKMPFRGDELSQRQFINAVIQSGLKIRNHIIECTEECISSGRLENLYVIISNVVMIRNYLWTFLEILDVEAASKLKSEYKEFCKLVEVVSEQMLQCQANLLTTYILHDEGSQDWSSNQSYYEGQRGSPTVQMFSYFLKEMQRDMWRIMPPKLSQRILAIILNDSLAILTARYSKIQPVASTLHQFICDLSNILATVEELIFHISSDLDQVCAELEPSMSKIIFSIHSKCNCLVTSLVLVGAPLQVLYKTFRRGLSDCNLLEQWNSLETPLQKPMWMNVLSTLCQRFQPTLNQRDWELVSTVKLLRCQPAVNWSLVYKVLTTNNCRLGTFILTLFPAVLVPANEFLLEGKSFKRCGLASCMSESCHALPKSVANHNVHACILYILVHTIPREHFVKAYRPVLSQINDWSIMDNTQVWTRQNRPVWFQAMIDILSPILKLVVQQLCVSIMTEKNPESREDPTQLVVDLLNILTELLSVIPRGFFLMCEEIDDMIPSAYYPVRNNVPVHFLVTTLYCLLNLGPGIISSAEHIVRSAALLAGIGTAEEPKQGIGKRIEPLLLATSERLCHLSDTDFDQAIHRLVSQIESMMKQTQAQLVKKRSGMPPAELTISNDVAELKADLLLTEVEGQLALRLVYYFLMTHGDLLEDFVTGKIQSPRENQDTKTQTSSTSKGAIAGEKLSDTLTPNVKVAPRIRTYTKNQSIVHRFQFVNQFRTFHEVLWNISDLDWIATVRYSKMGLHKSLILKHLEKRTEFALPRAQEDVSSDSGITDAHPGDKNILTGNMVDEIKALMMA